MARRLNKTFLTIKAGRPSNLRSAIRSRRRFYLLSLSPRDRWLNLVHLHRFPGIRGRLVVLVADRFFRAESYIARGPLSLLSAKNIGNVIYFSSGNLDDLKRRVLYLLTFYKFVRQRHGLAYVDATRISKTKSPTATTGYERFMAPYRREYNRSTILACILLLEKPTYSELLLNTGLDPKHLNTGLTSLFTVGEIVKAAGRYTSLRGYRSAVLSPFSTTELSRQRSLLIAKT